MHRRDSFTRQCHFYPRPPRGGRLPILIAPSFFLHFYPRPPRGGRPDRLWPALHPDRFLSTPSARRATIQRRHKDTDRLNFYPRPPRGGRLGTSSPPCPCGDFYPRPPRGGRHARRKKADLEHIFLSTPSARRATFLQSAGASSATFLSTPSARRATEALMDYYGELVISIHALREEGDMGAMG